MDTAVFGSIAAAATGAKRSRRAHELLQERLAASYAQIPAKWALGYQRQTDYISDISFDPCGELVAACSTDGRMVVHHLQQFACAVPNAEIVAGGMVDDAVDDALGRCADREADALAHGQAPVLPPRATEVNEHGMRVAARSSAARVEHSGRCDPLLSVSTGLGCRACCWNPQNANELIVGFANSSELHVYDLGAARPQRVARRLRSARSYGDTHGVSDVVAPRGAGFVAGGGRDGLLRVWDLRAASATVVPQNTNATCGWTMGARASVWRRTRASACFAASADGRHLYAATEEACILGWDVRKLNATLSTMRLGRVLDRAGGVVALSHHPRLRQTLVAQVSSGEMLALDVATSAVTALLDPSAAAEGPGATDSHDRASRAFLEATAAGEVAEEGGSTAGAVDWRVRRYRGAWLGSGGGGGGGGEPLWCCGRAGASELPCVRLSRGCHKLRVAAAVPSSAAVVAVDAHPHGHFLALGLRDNSIGLMAPIVPRPSAAPRDGWQQRVEAAVAARTDHAAHDAAMVRLGAMEDGGEGGDGAGGASGGASSAPPAETRRQVRAAPPPPRDGRDGEAVPAAAAQTAGAEADAPLPLPPTPPPPSAEELRLARLRRFERPADSNASVTSSVAALDAREAQEETAPRVATADAATTADQTTEAACRGAAGVAAAPSQQPPSANSSLPPASARAPTDAKPASASDAARGSSAAPAAAEDDEAAERALLENLIAGNGPRQAPIAARKPMHLQREPAAPPAAKKPRKQSSLDAFFRR